MKALPLINYTNDAHVRVGHVMPMPDAVRSVVLSTLQDADTAELMATDPVTFELFPIKIVRRGDQIIVASIRSGCNVENVGLTITTAVSQKEFASLCTELTALKDKLDQCCGQS